MMTNLKGVVWLLCVCLALPVAARTYEEIFTAKAEQAYNNDPNVWVYTAAFAKRFAMPDDWIDDDLKGAYAVAWRVENFDVRLWFPHKGPDVSMPVRRCFIDVYVPSDARIPWKDDNIAGQNYPTPKSPVYLVPQTEEDIKKSRSPIGIESPGKLSRKGVIAFGSVKEKLGGLFLNEFEKDLYPGITYIQFRKSCTDPPDLASWIEFQVDKIWQRDKYPPVSHRIDMPESFMKRLHADWYEKTGRKSAGEWGGILKQKNKRPSKVETHPGHPEDYMEE